MNGITDIPGALGASEQEIEYIDSVVIDDDEHADLRIASSALSAKPSSKGGPFKTPVVKGGDGKPLIIKGGGGGKTPPVIGGGGKTPPVIGGGGKTPPVIGGGGKTPPVIGGGAGKAPPIKPPVGGQQTKVLSAESVPAVPPTPSRLDQLLSVVNTATGVLSLIHPLNSVFNLDGTTTWPNGSVADAQGKSVTHPDGSVQNIDGTTVHADGTIEHADGSLEYKDGTLKLKDGAVKYPNGNWLHPDGTLTDAEGNVLGMVKPG